MDRLSGKETQSLMEAYASIYNKDLRNKLEEENKQIEELFENFLQFVDTLYNEGYDLSGYNCDDLCDLYSSCVEESYFDTYQENINESWADVVMPQLKSKVKDEIKRLGTQALTKYAPMAYKGAMGGLKDLGKSGIELAKTAWSPVAKIGRAHV